MTGAVQIFLTDPGARRARVHWAHDVPDRTPAHNARYEDGLTMEESFRSWDNAPRRAGGQEATMAPLEGAHGLRPSPHVQFGRAADRHGSSATSSIASVADLGCLPPFRQDVDRQRNRRKRADGEKDSPDPRPLSVAHTACEEQSDTGAEHAARRCDCPELWKR
jgi:hypothetical protein